MENQEKFEGGYEDSYQKRERLEKELKETFDRLLSAIKLLKKDSNQFFEFNQRFDSLRKQIEDLEKEENKLEEKDKQLSKRKEVPSDGAQKYDILMNEIIDNYEALLKIRNQIDDLYNECDALFEELTGSFGDFEGSQSVIRMEIKKEQELQRQLRELEN